MNPKDNPVMPESPHYGVPTSKEKLNAEEIIRRSRTDFSTNKVALRVGRVILSKYNKAHGTKLPYRFAG